MIENAQLEIARATNVTPVVGVGLVFFVEDAESKLEPLLRASLDLDVRDHGGERTDDGTGH